MAIKQDYLAEAMRLIDRRNQRQADLARVIARLDVEYGTGLSPWLRISGGACEHWPQHAKDEIRAINFDINRITDNALTRWRAAGKRLSTFVRQLHSCN